MLFQQKEFFKKKRVKSICLDIEETLVSQVFHFAIQLLPPEYTIEAVRTSFIW